MRTPLSCLTAIGLFLSIQTGGSCEELSLTPSQTSIPFDQLGAEAQKSYKGDGMGITPTADGARLKAVMQDLEAEATAEGLWLRSVADEDAGKNVRFRVKAAEVFCGDMTGIRHSSFVLL